MEEAVFPPSPSWFLPNIISTRDDGSVSYGSKNNVVVLRQLCKENAEVLVIRNAHLSKITSVSFPPSHCHDSFQNMVASCSEDGFVKLWSCDSLTALMGHKSHWERNEKETKVICLDWSLANPHQIVSAAENNTIVVWNILSSTTVRYSFKKLGPTVIACCPYNEKIVAVGGKAGQVFVVNLTGGNGDVIYSLRGHDNKIQSLTWCPVPFNVFAKEEVHRELLLASSCQNKEVFVWRAGSDGKCEAKFLIPTSAISKKDGGHGKLENSFSYSSLLWSEPYKIYICSNFGELIYFDVHSFGEQMKSGLIRQKLSKQMMGCFKVGHCYHSKGCFAIAGSPAKWEVVLYEDFDVKSELRLKIEANDCRVTRNQKTDDCSKKWEVVVSDTSTASSLLWTAGQDRKLIGLKMISGRLEIAHNFHTLNGTVYSIVVSPHDPNKIAFGVGDGAIRLWNLTQSSGDVQVYGKKVKDRVMELAWHPTKDGLLAYGTSEGRIGLIDTNSNKLPNVFKPCHSQPVYRLSWGPPFSPESRELTKPDFDLYSVGNMSLLVYSPSFLNDDPVNLSKIIRFPCKKQTDVSWKPDHSLMAVGNDDGSICLVEPVDFKIVATLQLFKSLVESIAWHPISTSVDSGISPYHNYFTAGSNDKSNVARVFACKREGTEVKVEQVASLQGHFGPVPTVSWSPHTGARLLSSSFDGSVQIWDVVSQSPLTNFKASSTPMTNLYSPVDADIVLTSCRADTLQLWRISKQTKISPTPVAKTKKPKQENQIRMISGMEGDPPEENVKPGKENGEISLVLAAAENPEKNLKEAKMFSRAWKSDAEDEIKNCYDLLKETDSGCDYSLSFFGGEEEFREMLKKEEEICKKSNNLTDYYELSLWSGNLKEIVEEKIKMGQLTDFLVSLTPAISPRIWQEACLSYSKNLAERKLFRKAATYLVACHKIYEAIELLTEANLCREALCIARCRLPKSDPIFEEIVRKYAESLYRCGVYAKACECYIYLKDYLEVAKICRKKSHPEYLSLAALAAKKCGSTELECVEATNAILKCFETNNFEIAKRVCRDHEELKHLHLLLKTYETIHQLESGELSIDKDIVAYIKESIWTEDIVFPKSTQHLYNKYASYKNKRQVLTIIAQELSFAACSTNQSDIITHIIKALSTCCRYTQSATNEVHLLYKVCCNWLKPDFFSIENHSPKTEDLTLKMKSLRAFWCSAIVRNLNDVSADKIEENVKTLSELADVLLDEEIHKYIANLLKVEICEKRLMNNQTRMTRIKLKMSSNSALPKTKEDCLKMNGESSKSESVELTNGEEGRNDEDKYSGDFDESVDETDIDLEEKVKEDMVLLEALRNEIENFEAVRVSSPNPVPVYYMLKKLLETVPENESARILLENLKKKWLELN